MTPKSITFTHIHFLSLNYLYLDQLGKIPHFVDSSYYYLLFKDQH